MTCAYLMHPHLQVPQAKRAAHKPETVVKASCSRITKCTACPSVLFGPVRPTRLLRLGWLNSWIGVAGCAPNSVFVLSTHPIVPIAGVWPAAHHHTPGGAQPVLGLAGAACLHLHPGARGRFAACGGEVHGMHSMHCLGFIIRPNAMGPARCRRLTASPRMPTRLQCRAC